MTSMTSTRFVLTPLRFLGLVVAALVFGVAVGMMPPLVALLFTVGIVVAMLVLRLPLIGMVLLAFALPFERIGAYESTIGTLRASQLLLGITVCAWLVACLRRRAWRLRPNPLTVPLLLFLAVNLLGLTQSPNREYSMLIFLLTSFTMLVAWVLPQIVRTERHLLLLVRALFFGALLVSIFGLWQFFGDLAGLPTTVTGLRDLYTKEVFGFPRVQSTTLEPLYFANYLLLPLGIAYALVLRRRAAFPAWLLWGLFGLFGVNLVLTVSRGGYLGAAVTLLAISVLAWKNVLRARMLFPLFLGGFVLLTAVPQFLSVGDLARLNVETFTEHVQSVFAGPSFAERVVTMEKARELFWHSPLVGSGPGSFGPFAAAHPLVKPESGWLIVNNETLELLAETGLLGFLSIGASVLILFVRSLRSLRTTGSPFLHGVHLAAFGAFLGVLMQYQTFSVLYIMHVWFLAGLLVAAQNALLKPEDHHAH